MIFRSKDKNDLKKAYRQKNEGLKYIVGPENDSYIQNSINEADRILVAWGGSPDNFENVYDYRIKQIHQLLGNREIQYIDTLSNNKYPKHAQIWSDKPTIKNYRTDCPLLIS